MLEGFSQRLLTLLQFTRMALVFTAISNSLSELLIARHVALEPGQPLSANLNLFEVILIILVSIGLYGFGMSLNDIIDRRRDSTTASHRPLPSGRIRVSTAHTICIALALLSLGAGFGYAAISGNGWHSWTMVMWVGSLIAFYDLAGKWLVGPGLLTLGLIRMFHCLIPDPDMPAIWHPLVLFTHVAVLSAIAYAWEQKRPALTRLHWLTVIGGVLAVDLAIILAVPPGRLVLSPRLLAIPALMLAFIALGWLIHHRAKSPREAGQRLMLAGLLWLILYDSTFVSIHLGWTYGVLILALLPLSYLMVLAIRWWSRILWIAQAPKYRRVRSGPQSPS